MPKPSYDKIFTLFDYDERGSNQDQENNYLESDKVEFDYMLQNHNFFEEKY